MKSSTSNIRPGVILAVMIGLGVAAVVINILYKAQITREASQGKDAASLIGRHRPEFTLSDLDGFPRDNREWDGRVVVLNFWAVWCRPCRREMPAFIRIQHRFGAQGVQFVGIDLDTVDARKVVQKYLGEFAQKINYPVLLGDDDGIDIARAYGNAFGVLPYTVVIGRDGRIAHIQYGEWSEEAASEVIGRQLGVQQPK